MAPRTGLFLGVLLSLASIIGMNLHLLLLKHIPPQSCLTQLDEGPETPRATQEASGFPFLRQDEA